MSDPAEHASPATSAAPSPGPDPRPLISPRATLLLLAGTFFALAVLLSSLRLLEFQPGNWDLGIPQQALWSTAHGHPLYEAGDYAQFGAGSWFEIHPSLLPLALVPLYAAAPSPFTLFVAQAAVVAAAAVPLYLLARDVTGSERKALLSAAVYLAFPPVLSADLYDFHLEAFLPLELFALFLLWRRRRYGWGSLAAVIACVTLEVGPVFVAAIAAFFLIPPVDQALARARAAVRAEGPDSGWTAGARYLWRSLGPWLRRREVGATLALGVLAVAAYVLLRAAEQDPASIFLGPVPVSGNPSVAVQGAGQLGVQLGHAGVAVAQKAFYWLLLYGLLAFLPLRALRTQVIALPWFVYTILGVDTLTQLGLQYGFLAAVPLLLGFVYGLEDLQLAPLSEAWAWACVRLWPDRGHEPAGGEVAPLRATASTSRACAWTLVLVAALLACGVASPADPLVQNHALENGYDVSYLPGPGYAQVQQLAGLVPAGATVLASNDLFPFVANDLHAYALLWGNGQLPDLPFNASHLPTYVLLASSQDGSLPPWLVPLLSEPPVYGLRGQVAPTEAGTVSLFLVGYQGTPEIWTT